MPRKFTSSSEENPKPGGSADVTAYINAAPTNAKARLREMRSCLKKAAPKAKESLKWGVPAISYERILFTYAAFRNHVSLFPTPKAIRAFAAQLTGLKTSSSTIQFPLDKPLPVSLIRRIAQFRVRDFKENDARWM